jgi:hypothetical protein
LLLTRIRILFFFFGLIFSIMTAYSAGLTGFYSIIIAGGC